ncbi:hypothetical protein L6R29_10360 [Myxococcota bacterium]|nr:hypothetical protein [Myxococcota bacterium]
MHLLNAQEQRWVAKNPHTQAFKPPTHPSFCSSALSVGLSACKCGV